MLMLCFSVYIEDMEPELSMYKLNGIENITSFKTSLIVSKHSEYPAKAIVLQIYVPNTLYTLHQEHTSVILLLSLDILNF